VLQGAERKFGKMVTFLDFRRQALLILCTVGLLFGMGLMTRMLIARIPDPSSWSAVSSAPRDFHRFLRSIGGALGASFGVVMASRWVHFEPRIGLPRRVVVLAYVLVGVWCIRASEGILNPASAWHMLRFPWEILIPAALNFWILFAAPWLLLKTQVLKASVRSERF
jgi:hypothetical protein